MSKPVVILDGEINTPPFSPMARRYAGYLLRMLQEGRNLSMPDSRPMPSIGSRCHELRIRDAQTRVIWRIMYRVDEDSIVIADIFAKKTRKTPTESMERSRKRLRHYDEDRGQR